MLTACPNCGLCLSAPADANSNFCRNCGACVNAEAERNLLAQERRTTAIGAGAFAALIAFILALIAHFR